MPGAMSAHPFFRPCGGIERSTPRTSHSKCPSESLDTPSSMPSLVSSPTKPLDDGPFTPSTAGVLAKLTPDSIRNMHETGSLIRSVLKAPQSSHQAKRQTPHGRLLLSAENLPLLSNQFRPIVLYRSPLLLIVSGKVHLGPWYNDPALPGMSN